MKHFKEELFKEILEGMKATCGTEHVEQLLAAAAQIYIASEAQEEEKNGEWIMYSVTPAMYKVSKMVKCPFCGKERAWFIADSIDYCPGCKARLKIKCKY